MEQRRSWFQRKLNLSGGDKRPQTQGSTEFVPVMRPPPSQPSTAFQLPVNQPPSQSSTVFQPAVNQPPTQSKTEFQMPVIHPPINPGMMFQPATYINTSVFRQVLIDATPNQNTNNVLDNFNGIVDSMKSGYVQHWNIFFPLSHYFEL
jgi:hypothetical protein